jgi:diaminopimelate epimerase
MPLPSGHAWNLARRLPAAYGDVRVLRRFEKWEGLGNDFVLVEGEVSAADARRVCDRRLGIGADGILCLNVLDDGALRMVVLNADGSRPEMCGNGVRCAVGWEAERRRQATGEIVVVSDAGERRCRFEREAPGRYRVRAGMGHARLGGMFSHVHDGRTLRFARVDVGNPHAVCFDDVDGAVLDVLGPAVERSVPGGINVELASTEGRRIQAVVWERGVGRTLACGTGACAVAAAAVSDGRASYDTAIDVVLPGGALEVVVGHEGQLTMSGPAGRVFVGEVAL